MTNAITGIVNIHNAKHSMSRSESEYQPAIVNHWQIAEALWKSDNVKWTLLELPQVDTDHQGASSAFPDISSYRSCVMIHHYTAAFKNLAHLSPLANKRVHKYKLKITLNLQRVTNTQTLEPL